MCYTRYISLRWGITYQLYCHCYWSLFGLIAMDLVLANTTKKTFGNLRKPFALHLPTASPFLFLSYPLTGSIAIVQEGINSKAIESICNALFHIPCLIYVKHMSLHTFMHMYKVTIQCSIWKSNTLCYVTNIYMFILSVCVFDKSAFEFWAAGLKTCIPFV